METAASPIATPAQDTPIDTGETGSSFQVAASFGISVAMRSGYDLTTLLSQADKALYRAKNEGRNCVRMHGEEGAAERADHGSRPSLRLAHPAGDA